MKRFQSFIKENYSSGMDLTALSAETKSDWEALIYELNDAIVDAQRVEILRTIALGNAFSIGHTLTVSDMEQIVGKSYKKKAQLDKVLNHPDIDIPVGRFDEYSEYEIGDLNDPESGSYWHMDFDKNKLHTLAEAHAAYDFMLSFTKEDFKKLFRTFVDKQKVKSICLTVPGEYSTLQNVLKRLGVTKGWTNDTSSDGGMSRFFKKGTMEFGISLLHGATYSTGKGEIDFLDVKTKLHKKNPMRNNIRDRYKHGIPDATLKDLQDLMSKDKKGTPYLLTWSGDDRGKKYGFCQVTMLGDSREDNNPNAYKQ